MDVSKDLPVIRALHHGRQSVIRGRLVRKASSGVAGRHLNAGMSDSDPMAHFVHGDGSDVMPGGTYLSGRVPPVVDVKERCAICPVLKSGALASPANAKASTMFSTPAPACRQAIKSLLSMPCPPCAREPQARRRARRRKHQSPIPTQALPTNGVEESIWSVDSIHAHPARRTGGAAHFATGPARALRASMHRAPRRDCSVESAETVA